MYHIYVLILKIVNHVSIENHESLLLQIYEGLLLQIFLKTQTF